MCRGFEIIVLFVFVCIIIEWVVLVWFCRIMVFLMFCFWLVWIIILISVFRLILVILVVFVVFMIGLVLVRIIN